MLQQIAMKAVIANKAGQVLILREAATHGEERQIIGVYFACHLKSENDTVTLSTEHDRFAWIDPKKRADYDIMEPEGQVIDRAVSLAS